MKYEFHRELLPWGWSFTASGSFIKTEGRAEQLARGFINYISPAELKNTSLADNRVSYDLVNFKGREPGEGVLQHHTSNSPAEHELLFLQGSLTEEPPESEGEVTIQITTPFKEFRGSDLVFETKVASSGALPTWAHLSSLWDTVHFNIQTLRCGATSYRKRFGSFLGIAPVIEEQFLLDVYQTEIAFEYRRFNLREKLLPKDAWLRRLGLDSAEIA